MFSVTTVIAEIAEGMRYAEADLSCHVQTSGSLAVGQAGRGAGEDESERPPNSVAL
jgi:hypothetical protein